MARISLKNIVGKNAPFNAVFVELIDKTGAAVWIENNKGDVILGSAGTDQQIHSIEMDGEYLGSVKGNEDASLIAQLLQNLVLKEAEKKKLGHEVLTTYQELNVIFNFTETLTQTIDPDIIANLTLEQATHSISPDGGVIILWDEDKKVLEIPASSGEDLFNKNNLRTNIGLLLKIGLNGQSEIINDISILKSKGIIAENVQSLMYAAMKVKHRIMGAIILAGTRPDQFSAANLKLLVTLALQSSAAIDSALLYEKNIQEVKEREEAILRIHEVTKRFVPIEFIRSLGKEIITDVKLGDQAEKIVTVLFTDIRDFTTLSEEMTPEENFRFVSSFNARLGPIIRSNNGFINQYLGDSIMAIFPEKADDAIKAAIEMQKAVHELNAERIKEDLPLIKAGIGMHTGPLIMGITGDEHRMDAATISDTVNTAARIESLTKYYRSPLLLSEKTYEQLRETKHLHLRKLGSVLLKGKNNYLNIIECIDGAEDEVLEKRIQTLPVFKSAMEHYRNRDFEKAIKLMFSIIETDPNDLTIQHFIENAKKYLRTGVPENWTGTEEMASK